LVNEFEKSYGDLQNKHTVVKKVSMVLCRGNTLGLIGESGSGKTTLAKMILNILERDSGYLKLTIDGLEMENLITPHRQIGAVMQDSAGSLNPRMNIHEALSEPLELMGLSDRHVKKRKVVAMMNDVGLDQELLMRYPHSLSGGQRQRVSLARAMMLEPSILILDEPTSALDVNVQKKILELLKSLQKEKNLSYLFISHDLAVISEMANDVGVMYDGEIVEFGSVEKILNKPEQAYTQKLVDSSVWTSATET
jgi:ABC-type microcin C transport system duplicated ATPase subunit YejF